MSVDAKATLVFAPFPFMSHLISAVELAKLLIVRDNRLVVTILVMKLGMYVAETAKITSYTANPPHPRINFLHLQENKSDLPPPTRAKNQILHFVESQKGPARDAVAEMMERRNGRLAGFVLDMLCTPMIDVANELAAPAYIFFPCGSACLGLMLHLQILHDRRGGEMEE